MNGTNTIFTSLFSDISWSSINTDIATVTNGEVVAHNPGITEIKAIYTNADTITTNTAVVKVRPFAPKNLISICSKNPRIKLKWESSKGAVFYKLYRNNKVHADVITTTNYTDTGLTPSTSYTYELKSCIDSSTCSLDSSQFKSIPNRSEGNTTPFGEIIDSGQIPEDLTDYDERSREIFSLYNSGVSIVAKYLKPGGTGDGSSFSEAAGNLNNVLRGITDAATDKVYTVLLTGGNYTNGDSVSMKNHVAIIGGVDECLGSSDTVTALDGEGNHQVFNNNSLDNTALLYGVTVTNGKAKQHGGGMFNNKSSPSLVRVTFSGNSANQNGGGMYNNNFSSPSLAGVTFSGNTTTGNGGGMFNNKSSPSLVGVTFSGNTTTGNGGGMFNDGSSPSLAGVTFSENTAYGGGGMFNYHLSSPNLVGVTFSGNAATNKGGGIFIDSNNNKVDPLIINGIFWGNTANSDPQIYLTVNNNGGTAQKESLRLYNSIVEGGANALVSGITYSNIIADNPQLGDLANNGGSVLTHAITGTSSAVDRGLYVKKKATTVNDKKEYTYYSKDSTTWYTEPDLSGKEVTPPTDVEDLTATDATGYTRTSRPDLGAYEAR